ncbi:MAG: hypothetical protein M3303_01515 [Gemmatimonadota bacterium]|nr:hypothetical protein [Gemmatimonadota bacterium]
MKRFLVHLVAAGIVVAALALAYWAPERYDALMEEDRAVEWATVVMFLVAGVVRGYAALRTRRVFDALVGVFCLFVAGEEISWGQRLVGYTPPDVFLEHNTQQEANVHNFADVFGRPKWMLIMALAGYGLVLPALAATRPTRRLLDRVGATAPSLAVAPWFLAAVGLLIWYPVTFTGEWVELLAGWLFVASAPLSPRATTLTAVAAVPAALAMTWLSAVRRPSDAVQVTCARAEVRALVDDIVRGHAATPDLDQMASIHKRVWGSVTSGFIDDPLLRSFRAVSCGGEDRAGSAVARRRYIVDPWGTAYWVAVTRDDESGSRRVVVYSFGPNRRRDGEPGATTGDDIHAEAVRH